MKVPNIKHFLVCLIWSIGYQLTNAQGLTVHMTDGTNIKVPFEKLDSITTYITEEESASIIGTWRCNTDDGYKTLTFNTDGTGVDYEYWEYDNDSLTSGFTWRTKGEVLTLIYDDETGIVNCAFVVAPEILIINWGEDYESYVKSAGENEDPNTDPNYPVRGPVARSFKGSGTKNDPYIISKASELRKLADDVTDKGKAYVGAYFFQTADITINRNVLNANGELNGNGDALEQWKPIGNTATEKFHGIYDGGNHSIYGIYINEDSNEGYKGSFVGGTIKNLIIRDSYITGGHYLAGIGGNNVSNCVNYATVTGSGWASGITSEDRSIVYGCRNYGKIKGRYSAGIAGKAQRVDHCVNYGEIVSPNLHAAGISQWTTSTRDTIRNCVNYGYIKGIRVAGIKYGAGDLVGCCYNNINYGSLEGNVGGGILCNQVLFMENNVNFGRNEGGADIYGLYYYTARILLTRIKNNYYLASSYLKMFGGTSDIVGTSVNNREMTEEEMKSQTFLDELNRNARALGSEYSRWKFGKDGFPILEWIEE